MSAVIQEKTLKNYPRGAPRDGVGTGPMIVVTPFVNTVILRLMEILNMVIVQIIIVVQHVMLTKIVFGIFAMEEAMDHGHIVVEVVIIKLLIAIVKK